MRPTAWLLLAAINLPLAPAAIRPRYGGTLSVESAAVFRALEPVASEPAAEASARDRVGTLVFETLVQLDEKGRPQPGLAGQWESDAGRRRWQLRLEHGVRCHDGSELAAEAVAASLTAANSSWRVTAEADRVIIQTAQASPDLPVELAEPRNAVILRRDDGAVYGTGPFRVAQWEPGRALALEAHEGYRGGRPFLDGVLIRMGRSVKERLLEFELGRADIIEVRPDEVRRVAQRGTRIWSTALVRLMALAFETGRPAAENERLREAIALSIDRRAIHSVLLQKQGEPAGGLLPQWLTGYAFLFPAARDVSRASQLAATLPAPLKQILLAVSDANPLARAVAERIALNARDAGMAVRVSSQPGPADVRLVELRLAATSPERAFAGIAAALRLPDAPPGADSSLESLYAAEAAALHDFRVIPLFHLPELYAVSPGVKTRGSAGVLPGGAWRFEDLWLEAPKP